MFILCVLDEIVSFTKVYISWCNNWCWWYAFCGIYYWHIHSNIQILGYLSGSSPHIKSGAVSALSVLVYRDTNLCLSVSVLVPSLLSLLLTKDVEIIKVSVLLLFQDQCMVWAFFCYSYEFNLASITGCLGLCKSDGVLLTSKRVAEFSLRCCCCNPPLVVCFKTLF